MSEVFPFPPHGPRHLAPDARVVRLCEDLLVVARSGRIRNDGGSHLCEPTLQPVLQLIDAPEHAMALSGAAAKLACDIGET